MGVAVVGMVGLAALFRFTAIGLRMRAVVESPRHDRAERHPRRPGVGVQLGAVEPLRRAWPGVLIAPRFNTLGGARLLQPGRRGHRRRRRRPAGQPAARAGRRPRPRHLHRPLRHVPAALVRRLRAGCGRSRRTSPRRCRSSCCSGSSCSGPAIRRTREADRPAVGRRPAAAVARRRRRAAAGLTRATRIFARRVLRRHRARRVHPGRRRRGCSSSPRP